MYLSEADAHALDLARIVLMRLSEAAQRDYENPQAYERGRFSQACDTAQEAVFDALNSASAYLHDENARAAIAARLAR